MRLRNREAEWNNWPIKQKYLSPRYTTRWEDILSAKW
ncbi:DUF4113 domain-containing protein [Spirosoma endophyticum]|nr:DUF4113 domain-containing protein [Spirosoma endophyticum]